MHDPSGGGGAPAGRPVLPEPTERGSLGTRTTDTYARLLSERVVFLGSTVDDAAAADVTARLLHLARLAPDEDIQLYVNSPGGSFTAMAAIHDTMCCLDCDVQTVCLGQAGPVAAVLLAAGAAGKRLALPGARVLLEQPRYGGPAQGPFRDVERQAAELRRQRDQLATLLAEHTGRPAESVHADLERVTVLDGEGAKAYGIVDHLVRSRTVGPAHGSWDGPPSGGR